jgi:hypothetical protein
MTDLTLQQRLQLLVQHGDYARFTGVPLKVVVSQDASTTGADPGATQGAAVLYLDVSTPS